MYRVSFVSALAIASAAAAEPVSLDSRTLSQLVPGATVQLDTPMGTKLPVKYASNGMMSGEAPALAFFLGAPSDRGRWWIAGNQLCHKWFKWFDAEVQCLHLKRDGSHILWSRDDGKTGTATLLPAEPVTTAPYALGNPEPARDGAGPNARAMAVATPEPDMAPRAAAFESDATGATAGATPRQKAVSPAPAKEAAVHPAPLAKAPAPRLVPTKMAALSAPPAIATAPAPASPAPAKAVPNTAPKAMAPAAARKVEAPTTNVVFKVTGVRADDVLNVRQGPSADAPAVGRIPPFGDGVRLLGRCQQDWCPVTHRGVSGWVNSYYLVEDRPAAR